MSDYRLSPRSHNGYAHYTVPPRSTHSGGRPREYIVQTSRDILVESSHPVVVIDERSHHRGSRDRDHYSHGDHDGHTHHLSGTRSSAHAHDGSYSHSHSHSHNHLLSDPHSSHPPYQQYSDLPLHHRDHRSDRTSNQPGVGQLKRPWLHPQHERCPPPHYGIGQSIAGFLLCNEQLRRRGKEMRRSAFETRRRERNYRRAELRAEMEESRNQGRRA